MYGHLLTSTGAAAIQTDSLPSPEAASGGAGSGETTASGNWLTWAVTLTQPFSAASGNWLTWAVTLTQPYSEPDQIIEETSIAKARLDKRRSDLPLSVFWCKGVDGQHFVAECLNTLSDGIQENNGWSKERIDYLPEHRKINPISQQAMENVNFRDITKPHIGQFIGKGTTCYVESARVYPGPFSTNSWNTVKSRKMPLFENSAPEQSPLNMANAVLPTTSKSSAVYPLGNKQPVWCVAKKYFPNISTEVDIITESQLMDASSAVAPKVFGYSKTVDPHGTASFILFMEMARGMLGEYFWQKYWPELTDEQIKKIAFNMLKSVTTMHTAGVVHNDLQLKNIFICPKKLTIQIIDFGLAQSFDLSSSEYIKYSKNDVYHLEIFLTTLASNAASTTRDLIQQIVERLQKRQHPSDLLDPELCSRLADLTQA